MDHDRLAYVIRPRALKRMDIVEDVVTAGPEHTHYGCEDLGKICYPHEKAVGRADQVERRARHAAQISSVGPHELDSQAQLLRPLVCDIKLTLRNVGRHDRCAETRQRKCRVVVAATENECALTLEAATEGLDQVKRCTGEGQFWFAGALEPQAIAVTQFLPSDRRPVPIASVRVVHVHRRIQPPLNLSSPRTSKFSCAHPLYLGPFGYLHPNISIPVASGQAPAGTLCQGLPFYPTVMTTFPFLCPLSTYL